DFANEQYAQASVEALVARGRKKLAILLPREGGTFRMHLLEGFMQACEQAKVEGVTAANLDMDGSSEHIYTWATKKAKQYDGLVVTRESPLMALMGGLGDAGLVLGRELDVVTKYSTSTPMYLRQPLLGCFEDIEMTGRTIAQRLLHQLDPAHHASPSTYLFAPPLIKEIYDYS
ncbi:MAG: LacI family transcriptional regulator, partial [Burkholderiaceae bacterium]